ncbi:MAG TPA: DMT family transporter [Flavisolibacter sp.]|jgi:drug/metabolite transporter (DMT)-like permease|nr:DMT family transporter [Flavisolibacter sp.]
MKTGDLFQLLLLAAIWGSSYLFLKIVTPSIGVSMTMGSRILIAAIAMVAVFGALKQWPKYNLYWKQYFVLGILNLVLPFSLTSYAITYLNASIGSILNATTPLFTMILSSLLLKERLTPKKIIGLLIGLTGLIILVGWIPLALSGNVIVSLIFSLLAALSYGFGAVFARMNFKNAEPIKTATGQLSAAAILVIPFITNAYSESLFTPQIAIMLLVLAIFCTALGYALYFRLIASIGSTNASLVTLLVPVFSLLWSILFLHEPITPALLIGLALIMGSLKLVLSPS